MKHMCIASIFIKKKMLLFPGFLCISGALLQKLSIINLDHHQNRQHGLMVVY